MSVPQIGGFHHFSPTVTDVEASATWYADVFGMTRLPVTFPHHGAPDSGHAVLLIEPRSGVVIGLHHHEANAGEPSAEVRTGLDHMAFSVAGVAELDAWADRLDTLGIAHSGRIDITSPAPYSVVVFRDPDNIQLEFIHMPG